jgi:hypothetical protein
MTKDKLEIKPELYPKLVFMQLLSDKYLDNVLFSYGLTNRKEEFAGHEFHIEYFNEYIKCSIWTDCDNYSIQYIDLYRLDKLYNTRIDFWNLNETIAIQNLYAESSKESEPLSKTFVEKYLDKKGEYEELNKPLKEYYERKGAKLFEQNFQLHSDFFKQHPELFRHDYELNDVMNKNSTVIIKPDNIVDIKSNKDLTFMEKIKEYFGLWK